MVPQMYLQDLAEADAPKELIQGVQVGSVLPVAAASEYH